MLEVMLFLAVLCLLVGAACLVVARGGLGRKALVGGAMLAPALSFAQSSDPYAAIVSAANWSQVTTDVVTVFAAFAAVVVVFTGGRMLLKAIRGR
jgi:hypothetical protein